MEGTHFNRLAINRLICRDKELADVISRDNSNAGLSRQLGVERTDIRTDPRKGGSEGYDVYFRIIALQYAQTYSISQASAIFNVSIASLYRWSKELIPKRMTSNRQREILTGPEQLLLTLAIYINPTSTADEIAAFIFREGGGIYYRRQIYRRLKELGVTRKKASVEAYAAFTPRNILRARMYWSHGPPVGIHGIPRRKLIDIDETRFALCKIRKNGIYGWGVRAVRVRDTGSYKKGDASINLIIAIEPGNPLIPNDQLGSIQHPRCWVKITKDNCNQFVFADFIDHICTDIEEDPYPGDEERYFLYDNHSAHLTPLVHATLEMRDSREQYKFTGIARPPYQPKMAPVEYIIGQIATKLWKRQKKDWTVETLTRALRNVCMRVGEGGVANDTFAFVGYD